MNKPIVIKVGTNVITAANGLLEENIIERVVSQIAALRQSGTAVILVTSGAMGAGRALIKPAKKLDPVSARQVLAAVGQIPLVNTYAKFFAEHNLQCAQVLATKEDFRDRAHYLNMEHCFKALLENGVVPVVNENDVVSVSELMFTDNDELAGLVAALIDAEQLILLSTVNGLEDQNGSVIATVTKTTDISACIRPDKSAFSRGGMEPKCRVALRLAKLGIPTRLINGRSPKNIARCLAGEAIGTAFVARANAPAIKRWLAHARGTEQGSITLNVCAAEVITDPKKAASILPVGIVGATGEFKKGDTIKIINAAGGTLGYGRAEYGAKDLKNNIGKKNKPEFIHYNYLFLEV